MQTEPSYTCSPSTTWAWKKVKIKAAAGPPKGQRPKGPAEPSLSRWNPRDRLTIQIVYRGGGECWYEVRARGKTIRLPGHLCLHDVMTKVYEDL